MEILSVDILIVGAGISGLSTALGLYRLGLKSLVLDSSDNLRVTGFAFTSWSNAWKALDSLAIGDVLRQNRPRQQALIAISAINGNITSEIPLISSSSGEKDYETRVLERKMLIETMANELPEGSIRFSSKAVKIEEHGHTKLIRLADESTITTKVLIGCDGVNSVVGRWLGLKEPQSVGKSTIRGFVRSPIEPTIRQFMGDGVKYGIVPIDENQLYWFLSYIEEEEVERNPEKMKQFVLSKLGKRSEKVRELVAETDVSDIICSPLKSRYPWEVLWGETSKGNVCVAGDAFHPMTPDLGQGANSSLEDGVVLARCLGRAMLQAREQGDDEEKAFQRIAMGLDEYAKERRWRAVLLTAVSYVVGSIELTSWKPLQRLRDDFLAPYLDGMVLKMAEFDCGRL